MASLDRSSPPAPGEIGPFEFPEVHRHTLPNGLRVLAVETGALPLVTVRTVTRAGGAAEQAAGAGVAALTAELLESGAGRLSAAEIAETFESLGVDAETGAGWDAAHAGLTALTGRLDAAWDLLAELVQNPTFPADEVERLRDERLSEIVQRRSQPGSLADEVIARAIFGVQQRFGVPLGGVPSTVAKIDRKEIVDFHTSRYASNTAAVIVAGNLPAAAAFEGAQRRYGGWAASTGGGNVASPRSSPAGGRVLLVDRPGAVQSEIRIGHLGVQRLVDDYFPIVVMNTVLGGSFSSRLNLNLREVHGYTYGVSSGFGMRRQAGPFLIATATETDVTVSAITEILKEVEHLRQGGVSSKELESASGYLAGVFPLRLQTTAGVTAHLAELEIYGLPDDHFDRYRERVLAVTAEEVLLAARTRLDPASLNVVVVGDAERLREPLDALGLGPVEPADVSMEGG